MDGFVFRQWCQRTWPGEDEAPCRPLVMGILNITPDSFYDGGSFVELNRAMARVEAMLEEGADVLDIGGESSRPGAISITTDEEIRRVVPIIERIRARYDIALSIDTCKPQVMREAVLAGASIINDIHALQAPGALDEAARLDVPICLMHRQGTAESMQEKPHYPLGVVSEVNAFFLERMQACAQAGIASSHLILDPGFGFGKTVQHNLDLTRHLSMFQVHQRPLLLGFSRKRTIGAISGQPPTHRLPGGLSLAVMAAQQGVGIIRTHDVMATKQALDMVHAVMHGVVEEATALTGDVVV